jgi:predicted lipoprotein with Yx(FWY)xxD motif
VAAALAVGALGSSAAARSSSSTRSAASPASSIGLRPTKIGRVIVDGAGKTLYLFEKDQTRRSTCYGSCAGTWPPVIVKARPRAMHGARATLIGTTRRRDGKLQATYAGHPLYYYAFDVQPGSLRGNGVDQYGAQWYAVRANGSAARRSSK